MCPWDAEFDHWQARVMFGLNKLTLEWQPGTPMPLSLPVDIIGGLELVSSETAVNPRRQLKSRGMNSHLVASSARERLTRLSTDFCDNSCTM